MNTRASPSELILRRPSGDNAVVSYDLWAWKWADNAVAATPADIVAHRLPADRQVKSAVPGLGEFVIQGDPHPAMAPFDPEQLFRVLRKRLGRHFILTDSAPALESVELYRDARGRGWRLDFAVARELVEHLLPVGLGNAFAELDMVVFEAWHQRIVRPGLPKRMSFEIGGHESGMIYEPEWHQVHAGLTSMVDGDYTILLNGRGDYVQCAGSAQHMTVECRIWTDRDFHHWVAGTQVENAELAEVIGPAGPMKLRGYEVLSASQASTIFRAFFNSGTRLGRFRWRDITSTFR